MAPLGSIAENEVEGVILLSGGGFEAAKEVTVHRDSADLDKENAKAGNLLDPVPGSGTPGVILKEWEDAQKRRKRRLGPATALLSLGSNLLDDEGPSLGQELQIKRSGRRRGSLALR